jgi:hypothetical protein
MINVINILLDNILAIKCFFKLLEFQLEQIVLFLLLIFSLYYCNNEFHYIAKLQKDPPKHSLISLFNNNYRYLNCK